MAVCNECGNEIPGSITPRSFLDQLKDCAIQEGLCSMDSLSFKDATFKTTQIQKEKVEVLTQPKTPQTPCKVLKFISRSNQDIRLKACTVPV
jgi:hypothetical protein